MQNTKAPPARRIALAAVALCAVAGIGAAPADASTASRLRKLEQQAQNQIRVNRTLRTQLDTANARADRIETGLRDTITLLLGCFQSTSMDLDAATSVITGASFIAPSLNLTNAGPLYLATINSACVGAITPPFVARAARSSRRMFPTAHLSFPVLP